MLSTVSRAFPDAQASSALPGAAVAVPADTVGTGLRAPPSSDRRRISLEAFSRLLACEQQEYEARRRLAV